LLLMPIKQISFYRIMTVILTMLTWKNWVNIWIN